MSNIMASQNTDLSSWGILYKGWENKRSVGDITSLLGHDFPNSLLSAGYPTVLASQLKVATK
jgi:hypothetical protein